ncbi:MAG TPA: vWA domain-containing protein, partial [Pseudomonadales bacterium]
MSISSNQSARSARLRAPRGAWLLLLWPLLWPLPASAAAAADVRIVVDVSARMGEADPENVRGRALALLLRSLPDSGRAGVWTYGQYVNLLVKYDTSDALWKETAAIRTAALQSVGRRANLPEALERASWDRDSAERPVHLVLLSDGHVDLSDDPAVDAEARRRLLADLAPQLAAAGYRVHTVAFSDGADLALLQGLADATGGHHTQLETAEALPEGLLALLGWVAGTAQVEVDEQGRFQVAPGTRELTVVKLGGGSVGQARLVAPSGERLGPQTPRQRVRWHLDEHYEMVSLNRPMAGVWRFEGDTRGIRVQAYGDLALRYPDLPATLFPGELRSFELLVTDEDGPVRDRAFLELLAVSAQLEGADGAEPVVVEPTADGSFQVHLQNLDEPGDYLLETRLQAPTFTHRLALPFTLVNPIGIEVHPAEDGFRVWAQVRAHELDHASLRMAALVRRPPGPVTLVPVEKLPAGLWRADLPGSKGLLEVAFDLSGKYLNGREFRLKTNPVRVVLPVTEVQYVNLDLRGRPLLARHLPAGQLPVTEPPAAPEPPAPPPRETTSAPPEAGL